MKSPIIRVGEKVPHLKERSGQIHRDLESSEQITVVHILDSLHLLCCCYHIWCCLSRSKRVGNPGQRSHACQETKPGHDARKGLTPELHPSVLPTFWSHEYYIHNSCHAYMLVICCLFNILSCRVGEHTKQCSEAIPTVYS